MVTDMKKILHFTEFLFLLIFCNIIPVCTIIKSVVLFKVCIITALTILFLFVLIHSEKITVDSRKLRRINKGCQLVEYAGFAAVSELFILPLYIAKAAPPAVNIVFSIAFPVIFIAFTLFCGIIRIVVSSKQVKLTDHILLFLFWWVPVVNIFLFRKLYKTGRREFTFESDRIELENARAENEICKTKYPVLMVHGIFFRDWQYFNYWGRVPAALIRNGADIYYGNQQSAGAIVRSAEELKQRILEVISETGAEKVNIIAHSKGGLDSRYAISRLGMDKYVATLTTINTPHGGCNMVDFLLSKCPQGLVNFVCKRYNGIFTKLGDNKPDFISGVRDLSAVSAKEFNRTVPDSPEVVYRSYMSVMSSWRSAFFPLCFSYLLIKKLDGENDGLVYAESARHGDFELIRAPRRRGICHGDVIDLMRENIEGYDVREFYIKLVENLKKSGF